MNWVNSGNQDAAAELRKELQTLRTRVESLELEVKSKEEEIKRLNKHPPEQQGRPPDERIKVCIFFLTLYIVLDCHGQLTERVKCVRLRYT